MSEYRRYPRYMSCAEHDIGGMCAAAATGAWPVEIDPKYVRHGIIRL